MLRLLCINCKLNLAYTSFLYLISKYRAHKVTRRSRDGQGRESVRRPGLVITERAEIYEFLKNKSPVLAGHFVYVRVVLIAFSIIIALILKEHKLLFVFKISNYF